MFADMFAFVSNEQGRAGRSRKENKVAVEELHPVLLSGFNSCLTQSKYLRSGYSQLFSVFHMVHTKHKYKMQLQQITGSHTFKL